MAHLLESQKLKKAMLKKVDAVLAAAASVTDYWAHHNPHCDGGHDDGVEMRLGDALDKLTIAMSELKEEAFDVWNFLNTSKISEAKQKATRRTKAQK